MLARLGALMILALAFPAAAQPVPNGWLDDSGRPETQAWVARENRATLAALMADPRFAALEAEAAAVLTDPGRLTDVELGGDHVLQYHQSKEAPLGVWRRAPRAGWLAGRPEWQVLIDLDRLSAAEGRTLFFAGASCRGTRCLVRLSGNGRDAVETREFDLSTASFVADGFRIPMSKSRSWWFDEDRLLVAPVLGPDSLNRAELPRTLRLWKRGTPLAEAQPLFSIDHEDAMLSAALVRSGGREGFVGVRHTDFERKLYAWVGTDGRQRALPLPDYASMMGVADGSLLLRLNTDWKPAGAAQALPQGALVAVPLAPLLDGGSVAGARLLFRPEGDDALRGVLVAGDRLILDLLRQARSRLAELRPDGSTRILPLPEDRFITPLGLEGDRLLLRVEAPLVPEMLVLADPASGRMERLATGSPAFRADDLVSEQRQTVSRDGTPIRYTISYRRGLKLDGRNPTLIYGYGGYDVPVTPRYEPLFGKLWLERGGVYVHAYLRGGGEHGPAWHRGAMRRNRQQPYDDMAAVVAHLQAGGVASPATTGIMGRSNGGLMTAVVMQQIPEKLGAVVIGGPLIDMLRFHDMQPGGTWTAEYGDPRDPAMRPFLASYSPMQNIAPAARRRYPAPLIITSAEDDRVLPGHARRFAEGLRQAGHKAFYFEDGQGGHYWELAGGPSPGDWRLRARARAVEFAYLWQMLGGAGMR